jgi:hypothetical protein
MPNVPQHPPGITVRNRNRPGANLRRRTEPASANTLFYTALRVALTASGTIQAVVEWI